MRGRRAAVRRAPSSAVPRPRIRTPPARSSVIDRDRPRWAARSSRSRAASRLRSRPSGSTTATRCRPALVSSVASRDWAWRSISFSPRRRVQSPGGRSSTADTITSACSGEQVPATSAARVRDNGPDEGLGPGHPPLALTATQTGQVGDPVPGRPVGQLLCGEVSGVGLGQGPGLDRRRARRPAAGPGRQCRSARRRSGPTTASRPLRGPAPTRRRGPPRGRCRVRGPGSTYR